MRLNIIRISTDANIGTFGVLKFEDDQAPFALSCEDPWLNNEPWVSCIPQGDYICARVDSPKFGDTFQVMDVPDRTHILFHKGNTHLNTNGCILIGEQYDFLGGIPSVKASGDGFLEFKAMLEDQDDFELSLRWERYAI